MKHKALIFAVIIFAAVAAAGAVVSCILTELEVSAGSAQAVNAAYITILGMLLIVLVVEIVSAAKVEDSTYHTALIAGGLLTQYIFSTDMDEALSDWGAHISVGISGIISETAFVFTVLNCFLYIVYLYNLSTNKKALFGALAVIIAVFIGYAACIFYGYGYIIHFVLAAFITSGFFTVVYQAEKNRKIGLTTYFTIILFCLSTGIQNVNALYYSKATVMVPGISLAYSIVTLAMFLAVYLLFTIHSDSVAVKSTEYKRQAELFETRALSGQIKPHFIFNSLEAVRSLYHRDVASGDAAITYLSDFLRGSVNSFENELIPFETEIDNVFSYTEFENLKREDKIDIMFNIDYTDFYVPPFSIQPFVENAIKYSGVDKKENGYVVISSYKSGDYAVVEIADNGKGFDVTKISESSCGIRNAKGRFALTLGVVPEITSVIGEGTRIKIAIDSVKRRG